MECDDDDEDPHPRAKIKLKSYKFYWDDDRWNHTLLESEVGNACTWPPTASDLVYLGEEDDDPDYVCEVCQDGPFSPGRAWDAFYDRGYSIRESWCAGSRCKSLAMVDDEEEEEEPSSPSPAIKLSPVNVGASPHGQWNGGASGIINSPSLPPIPWPNVVCGSSCYSQAYCYSCQQWGNIVPVSPG